MSRHRERPTPLLKRGFDIVSASTGLLVLAPVMGILWMLIRVKIGSPVIFKQGRAGKNGRAFTLYKFRTMLELDPERGLILDDQRMTPFGRRLRALSLDELPTLFNVLKGDMSIVGPRPLHLEYLTKYTPHQARRHEVLPGITGLAQVAGRNSLSWEARFDLDVRYVDEYSFWLDIKLLAQTLSLVFSRSDVEAEGTTTMPSFTGQEPDDGLVEKLMSQRWHELWRTWQHDPRAVRTQGAETTQTGSTRYWVYLNQDQAPLCIAGLSGLGSEDVTASILTNPELVDQSFLPVVLNRLNMHGSFYKAERLIIKPANDDTMLLDVVYGKSFASQQFTPLAGEHTAAMRTDVVTLALASETRA